MAREKNENPYEPPQTTAEPPSHLRTRFHEWLVDRIMLVGCGCLSFLVVWGVVAMLIAFLVRGRL